MNCSCGTGISTGTGSMQPADQAVFRANDSDMGIGYHGTATHASATVTDSDENVMDGYDYNGAILFVVGLLLMYGLGMFVLIVSLLHKSRSELEVIDHLRDLEEMRKVARKKRRSGRFSLRSQTSQAADTASPELPERFSAGAGIMQPVEENQGIDNKASDPEREIFV